VPGAWWRSATTSCCARWRRWPAGRALAPNRPGRRPWPGWNPPSKGGLAARSETVVLLVTGREVKVGGAPADLGRVAVVETLDEVERALAGGR
jgi:hypothetical protein